MSQDNAEEILGNYKKMMAECQQIASKISEVSACCIFFFCIRVASLSILPPLLSPPPRNSSH